jgi:tRNA(Ile)-lysidine synthase
MTTATPGAELSAGAFLEPELAAIFASWGRYPCLALAVSGGADSVALMLLVRSWLDLAPGGPQITVLTVDHRLRAAAALEAEWVREQAAMLGFQHQTLLWEGEKPRSDLQAAARRARYGLMTAYCRAASIPGLATAHNRDDQAETVLMRLARGSGLDGLCAMEELSRREGIDILRPLLDVSHQRIEAFLLERGQPWLEDPSNDDARHERVRVRRKLKSGQMPALSPVALALSARRLRRAREALDRVTAEFVRAKVSLHEAGFAKLSLAGLFEIDEEIALRALARLILAVGGGNAPLRLSKLEAFYQRMRTVRRSATLGGCRLLARGPSLLVVREIGRIGASATSTIQPGETRLWDGRFTVTHCGAESGAATLRALGADGMRAVKTAGGHFGPLPALTVMALPSLWAGSELEFTPFAEFDGQVPRGWSTLSHAEFANSFPLSADREPPGDPHDGT